MLAAPGSPLTAALAVALVLAAFGRHPMWPDEPVNLNLSEAAAVRDSGEIVRLVERGENPDAARNVRPRTPSRRGRAAHADRGGGGLKGSSDRQSGSREWRRPGRVLVEPFAMSDRELGNDGAT